VLKTSSSKKKKSLLRPRASDGEKRKREGKKKAGVDVVVLLHDLGHGEKKKERRWSAAYRGRWGRERKKKGDTPHFFIQRAKEGEGEERSHPIGKVFPACTTGTVGGRMEKERGGKGKDRSETLRDKPHLTLKKEKRTSQVKRV